jgi:putative transposase
MQSVANTYTQIFLQFVFAVSRRQCLIPREHKEELHRYIGGLVTRRKSKPLAIHCMPDHAHIFVGYKPTISIPDFVKEIKVESNNFIKAKGWIQDPFKWQEGYGAFSYSRSHIGNVINYINNQEKHHQKQKFRDEYKELLVEFEIPFEDQYLFEFFD